jgi:hypothetical protein
MNGPAPRAAGHGFCQLGILLQLSLQHVHQQCIATDGDANFVRQPFHELRKARMFLKGCFVYGRCSEFIYF